MKIHISQEDLEKAIFYNGPLLTRGTFSKQDAKDCARRMLVGYRLAEVFEKLLEEGTGPIVDDGWINPVTFEALRMLDDLKHGQSMTLDHKLDSLVESAQKVVNIWVDQYSHMASEEEILVWQSFINELKQAKGE